MLAKGENNQAYVPSTEEIDAYKERPPILATIILVDGGEIIPDLPITPDVNVGKIISMCSNWLELTDPRIGNLGIFVYVLIPYSYSCVDLIELCYGYLSILLLSCFITPDALGSLGLFLS
tara:strand:- start:17 stop:376 length:360 start_codon:yes stop_codon:yes gene_type:complete